MMKHIAENMSQTDLQQKYDCIITDKKANNKSHLNDHIVEENLIKVWTKSKNLKPRGGQNDKSNAMSQFIEFSNVF